MFAYVYRWLFLLRSKLASYSIQFKWLNERHTHTTYTYTQSCCCRALEKLIENKRFVHGIRKILLCDNKKTGYVHVDITKPLAINWLWIYIDRFVLYCFGKCIQFKQLTDIQRNVWQELNNYWFHITPFRSLWVCVKFRGKQIPGAPAHSVLSWMASVQYAFGCECFVWLSHLALFFSRIMFQENCFRLHK